MITGRPIEGFAMENEVEFNLFARSALIEMYGRCRDLDSARTFYAGMERKDAVIWLTWSHIVVLHVLIFSGADADLF